ncbi:MAG: YggT family protein [Anaerolineales bacterium]
MAQLIVIVMNIFSILIVLYVILTYVLTPYHPVRESLDRIVEPMLAPIRRLLPYTGGLDFSPVVLLLLVQLIGRLLLGLVI